MICYDDEWIERKKQKKVSPLMFNRFVSDGKWPGKETGN